MSLPLFQVIRKHEAQGEPSWRKIDRDISLDTSFSHKVEHPDLGEHVDAVDPVDEATILQSRPMIHCFSASLPNKDGSYFVRRLDDFIATVFQLLGPCDRHPHVVRCACDVLASTDVGIHRTDPIHVAKNWFKNIDNRLRILGRDVVLALQFRFHKATTVDVACKISLCPAKEGFCWHVAWEPRVLFDCSPREGMGVHHFLCA
mmetsp:Transcript_10187/g.22554  ORF Transcript_10187/g.22554 Transcript_10187/m.22554 type:complete len:203 (+) Transcript_10187:985-1593(+)